LWFHPSWRIFFTDQFNRAGAAGRAPTTHKSNAKTQSYTGPVVNRGPYDGKCRSLTPEGIRDDSVGAFFRGP